MMAQEPSRGNARMSVSIIHDGSSRNRVARRACGAARFRGVLEQYVDGASGEPASRRHLAAANPRLQQKRS